MANRALGLIMHSYSIHITLNTVDNDIYTEQLYSSHWYPIDLQPWQYPPHSHWSTCSALVDVS